MYCVKGNSSWYISCRPLFGGCPLLGVSVIGGSTVYVLRVYTVVLSFHYSNVRMRVIRYGVYSLSAS